MNALLLTRYFWQKRQINTTVKVTINTLNLENDFWLHFVTLWLSKKIVKSFTDYTWYMYFFDSCKLIVNALSLSSRFKMVTMISTRVNYVYSISQICTGIVSLVKQNCRSFTLLHEFWAPNIYQATIQWNKIYITSHFHKSSTKMSLKQYKQDGCNINFIYTVLKSFDKGQLTKILIIWWFK